MKRLLAPLSTRRRNQLASLVTWPRLRGMRETARHPPILVSGAPRSGTTFLAEMLSDGTGGRILFEPLAHTLTYRRLRALTRPMVLLPSPDLMGALDWLFRQPLPYNHRIDHLAQARPYDGRIVKDLRLGFCLPQIAEAFPEVTILHVVRHPFDAIRSHLRLKLRVDHTTRARRRLGLLRATPELDDRIPWLHRIRVDTGSPAQMQLFEWCVTQFPVAKAAAAGQAAILRHADLARPETRAEALAGLAEILAARAIPFHRSRLQPERPSSTAAAVRADRADDILSAPDRARMFEILRETGMMATKTRDVFGQELA